MENALLIGLSRQAALGRQLDIVANNMANMRTAGYKSESLMFEEFLMPVAREQDMTGKDRNLSYVIDSGLSRDFSEGQFESTNNDLDIAIQGKGWLVVEMPDGERYTRDGELKLNVNGELVTTDGRRVLGEGGPIVFNSDERNISFGADGSISSSAGEKGRLRIVAFEQEGGLVKEGENLFSSKETPQPAQDFRLAQGMIERSNVKPVIETARMIEVTRAYVSVAQMLEQLQNLRRDAIDQLGNLPN